MRKRAVNRSEQVFYDVLGTELSDSAVINAKIQDAYRIIRERGAENGTDHGDAEKPSSRKRKGAGWNRWFMALGSMAAVLCVTITFCAANPVLAREIPILGSIFARLADGYPFGKLPEGDTVVMPPAAGLVSEDGGITISVTEEYASNQAVYIGVKIESRQAFPEMAAAVESGQQQIKARTVERYSFCPGERRNRRYIEGEFADAYTFLGIVRIDYDEIRNNMKQSGTADADADIPESFTMEWEIVEIAGILKDAELPEEYRVSDEEYEQMTEEEQTAYLDRIPKEWYGFVYQNWHQAGAWEFTLPVRQLDENARTITVQKYNQDGIGVESVAVSSTEMSVNAKLPEGSDLCAVVFDADGKRIRRRNSSNEGSALLTDGYDISCVAIYICDIAEYGRLSEQYGDEKLLQLLEETAVFRTVVDMKNTKK